MSRLREILELVEASLDEPDFSDGELAARAYLSRYHFARLARAALGEPPGAFRRRLLLERAAFRLREADDTVIDIAAEAGFASPDAFTRAFQRSFGRTPSGYRRDRTTSFLIASGNGIHFHPPGSIRLPALERSDTMDVLVRMYDHHVALTGQIVDRLETASTEVLDRPIELSVEGIDPDPTLRSVAARLVSQLEMWLTAIEGGTAIPAGATDPAGLRARLAEAAPRFRAAVVDPIGQGRSDETFVDATCEPPETFTLGGVLAHVLTFAAVRRTLAIGALDSAGISDLGAGDPMPYIGSGHDASEVERNFG